VIARVPVINGEMGEINCADTFINPLMNWLDARATGCLAWAGSARWACAVGPILITSYASTPTRCGAGYRAHLCSLS